MFIADLDWGSAREASGRGSVARLVRVVVTEEDTRAGETEWTLGHDVDECVWCDDAIRRITNGEEYRWAWGAEPFSPDAGRDER